MKFPLIYDATSTRAEFVRLLRLGLGIAELEESAEGIAGRGWSIRLTPLPPLAIGQVRLERHRVEIEFLGLSAAEQEAFMRRFALCQQRGGG